MNTESEPQDSETPESLLTPALESEEAPAAEEAPEEETSEEEAPEEEAPAEVAPLTADDITIPEGLEVSEEFRDQFLNIVNDQEMAPKDRAQALVDLQQKVLAEGAEQLTRQFDDQQKEWQNEVKADKEIGGANFEKHISKMGKLVEQYGSDELVQAFASTGAGNNIHVHRFLAKLADVALEGTPAQGGPTNVEQDRASRMFPSMKG